MTIKAQVDHCDSEAIIIAYDNPASSIASDDAMRAISNSMIISQRERTHLNAVAEKLIVQSRPRIMTGIDDVETPVYQQRWWLETARGTHRFVEAQVFYDGVVVGSLPYIVKRTKVGILWGASPDWCHLGGPILSPSLEHDEKADVLRQLIAQLPRGISFGFSCSPNAPDRHLIKQAFQAAGFDHTTETTYSQAPDDTDVLSRMNRKHRSHIRSAAKVLDVFEIAEEEFVQFYAVNLDAASIKSLGPLSVARDLIAKGRGADIPQVRVIAARRKTAGAPLDAAIACAWDTVRYYLWMSTRRRHADPSPYERPHPDAIKVLIVDAMAHAKRLGLVFDADGVSTPGAKILYREILRIPREEFRDVFERPTALARWYRGQMTKLKRIAVAYPG